MLESLVQTRDTWALLPIRLALGAIFIGHGGQKLFGWFGGYGPKGTIGYFQQALGVPPALTVLAMLAEFLGGLGVLLGFLTRPAAAGIIVVMPVAVAKVHWGHGFFLNWELKPERGHGIEMNLALIGMALTLLIAGGGAYSVDRLLR
ncbi:MAG: DoxX family protein [candidate division NC10 bacterium]|nr:DoxX family protein [candidate division NC10 bacterium]